MDVKTADYKNIIFRFLGFCLWALLVLRFADFTHFNTDEFWAWDIASDLNFVEIIKLMHYEGHSFLWYCVLKPFVHLSDIFPQIFPFVIKYVNLFFLFISMLLLWLYAPFNNFIKLLISVSSPFLILYPSIGRPYSLTIALIFLLTVLFKSKINKPIIYSLLLFLCAHSTLNGLFASMVFGVFFFFDLYKENRTNLFSKQVVIPSLIMLSAFMILVIEWVPIYFPSYIHTYGTIHYVHQFFIPDVSPMPLEAFITAFIYGPLLQIVLYFNVINNSENKKFLLFLFLIINGLFTFYLLIAPGRFHHFYFIYLFFIVVYWLMLDNSPNYTNNKPAYISYSLFLIIMSLLYNPMKFVDFWSWDIENFRNDAQEIKNEIPQNSTVFMPLDYSSGLVPYIKNYYDLKTPQGEKIPSLVAYQHIYQRKALPIDELPLNKEQDNFYIIPYRYLEDFNMLHFEKYPFCKYTGNELYLVCKLSKEEE